MRHTIFWLTGLSGSGKSTIAKELAKQVYAEILDGDDIRELMKNTDFSVEGRRRHMLSVAELAYRFSKYTNVIVALISPIKEVREEIKKKYHNIKEIYVKCDIEECKRRDPKGLYKKAINGEIKEFTGISADYEEPIVEGHNKSTFVDTEILDVEQCVEIILNREYGVHKHSLFIGRWQVPGGLHEGHKKLISKARCKPLIGIRNTEIDENNPYSVEERKHNIEKLGYETIVLPDIAEVVYGRGVGYDVRKVELDKETESISATKIRKGELNNG